MNKKTILSSILVLALCCSMIVGATFALFTSESETNIAVTSGKVDVQANITVEDLYSPTKLNPNGTVLENDNLASTENKLFANGGKVSLDGAQISISNMTPGDKVTFKVTMTNNSNVSLMQRMTVRCLDADKTFFDQLLIGVSSDNKDYTYYTDFASAWESDAAVYSGAKTAVKYISIELPGHVGNLYTDKTANLAVNVMAIQGNAVTVDEDSLLVHMINNQEELDAAIAVIKENESIYINADAVTPLALNYDGSNKITVRGYHLDHLTINAPNAAVHLYNDAESVNVTAVAMSSLHIYGNVKHIIMNNGRLVLEDNSVVNDLELTPAANENVALVIPDTTDTAVKAEVSNVVIPELADNSTVSIRVPSAMKSEVADMITGNGAANVAVGTSSAIKTAEDFITAVDSAFDGEIIKLDADITVNEMLEFDGGAEYTIDLNGYTLTVVSEEGNIHDGFVVSNGSTLNLTNSVENSGTYIFDCAKKNENAIYVINKEEGKTSTVNIKNPVNVVMDIKSGYAIHATASAGNSVVNIDEGTNILVTGQANNSVTAIYIALNSTLNMSGGELTVNISFDDNYDSWNRDACGIVLINNNAHAYVTGGEFNIIGKNAFAQFIQIATFNGKAENTDFLVSNATVNVENEGNCESYIFAIFDPSQGSGTVTNATITGNFEQFASQYYSGALQIEIVGGSFTCDPSEYLAEGSTVTENGGVYTVTPAAK